MSCSVFGPGTTATSSHPSSPQLSRICLVACTSSGTVTYSHFCMGETLAPGRADLLANLAGRELSGAGRELGHFGLAKLGRAGVRDRRLGLGHFLVAEVLRLFRSGSRTGAGPGMGPLEETQQLDRDRHDQRAVLLARDLDHGLQQPELKGGRIA